MRWVASGLVVVALGSAPAIASAESPGGVNRVDTADGNQEAVFESELSRYARAREFLNRLEAEREASTEAEFDADVARYLKLATFRRALEERNEAEEEQRFEQEFSVAIRMARLVQRLFDHEREHVPEALVPEPEEWRPRAVPNQ